MVYNILCIIVCICIDLRLPCAVDYCFGAGF